MQEHGKWVWAAYRMDDEFGGEIFPPEMDKDEFTDSLIIVHELFPDMTVMEAMSGKRGMTPVGLAVLSPHETRYYPHFDWFPWATPRNKLEAGIRFLSDVKERMIVPVPYDSVLFRYVTHLQRHALMRRVGTSENWDETKTAIFENKVMT